MGLILATFTGWGDAKAEKSMTPFERAVSTPKGQLKSPYADFASVAEEGQKIYLTHDCNGCHGGGGGGGMAAPLTNQVWIYGDDDDTLFRLITLGTGSLSPGNAFQKQGFVRKGSKTSSGECRLSARSSRLTLIWKIIAWIRSVNCERHRRGVRRTRVFVTVRCRPIHTAPYVKVRYWHSANAQTAPMNVCFEGKNGHETEDAGECPLMTQSGHSNHRRHAAQTRMAMLKSSKVVQEEQQ